LLVLPCYTFAVRRLVINADDFGLTSGVNRAIVEAHQRGVVSSATLMANGANFEQAVEMARHSPQLSVGCHVVLVDGDPLSNPKDVRSLLANDGGEPRLFYSRLSAFAVRAAFGRFDHDQVVGEIVAQVGKMRAAGIEVSHLDTHKHTHIFPTVLRALIAAARICGVPAIRNPIVPPKAFPISSLIGRPGMWSRYAQVWLLRSLGPQFQKQVKRAGLVVPDGVLGVVETGSLGESLLFQALKNLPEGTWELVTHPGYADADLRAAHTRLIESREQELRLLTSPGLRDFIDHEGIRLISFQELVQRGDSSERCLSPPQVHE